MITIGDRSRKFRVPVIIVSRPDIWANVRDVAIAVGAIITEEVPERFVVQLLPQDTEEALTLAELQALLPAVKQKK